MTIFDVQANKALTIEFAKFYYEERERLRGIPFVRNHALHNDKVFLHFTRAASLILDLDASFDDFLEAQIEGMGRVVTSDGEGIFPQPRHLGTSAAEDRYLEFMHENYPDEEPSKETVAILMETEWEKHRSIGDPCR